MEDLLELLVGLYFVVADNDEDDVAYSNEYRLLYSVIEGTEIEDCLNHAIYWIEYMTGEISEEIFRLMTDETIGM